MIRLTGFLYFALSLLLLTGCETPPRVVPAGPQTYMVSTGGGLGWTTSEAAARATVLRQAERFCKKRGLVMTPLTLDVHPGDLEEYEPAADLVFRALRPGDPEIGRKPLVIRRHEPLLIRESVVPYSRDSEPTR
jgi:hypothetical protein